MSGRTGIISEAMVAEARRFGEGDSDVLVRVFPWAEAVRTIPGGWRVYEDVEDAGGGMDG